MDVKTTCLGVLAMGDASGYEIRKHFEDGPFSHFAEGGFGSIYPALNRLTEEGLIDGTEQAQDKRPDKKVYRLNPKGFEALMHALGEAPGEDRYKSDLCFILFFADHIAPKRLEALIDARIAFYDEKLAHMAERSHGQDEAIGPDFVCGFGQSVYGAARQYLIDNKAALLERVAAAQNANAAE
jgi:DNA-binding PadR family transcriptional regulator